MNRKTAMHLLSIGLFLLEVSCQSVPPDGKTLTKAKAQTLVAGVIKVPVQVKETFPGPTGLTGMILQGQRSRLAVLYATNDGSTLIAGPLFDQKGANLSKAAYQRYAATHPQNSNDPENSVGNPLTEGIMERVETETRFIPDGTGNRVIWIFFDPDCIWCHRLFVMINKHPLPENIQLRWIPVAFLKPDSKGKSEFILKQGYQALAQNEQVFDKKNEEGGAPTASDPELSRSIRKNSRLLSLVGNGGMETPTILYRQKQGATMIAGFPEPEDWQTVLRQVSH